jgi:Ca2+:H+ antiporter
MTQTDFFPPAFARRTCMNHAPDIARSPSPPSSHNALAQPTSSLPLAEDEEEPPSSGYRNPSSSSALKGVRMRTRIDSDGTYGDPKREETVAAPASANLPLPGPTVAFATRVRNVLRRKDDDDHRRLVAPSYKASLLAAARYSPLNVCLVFIPVSWALHFTHQSHTLVFVFSALGLIPLAALLGLGTEQIALRTSQAVGGLLNASLGNVVELIIAGIALEKVCGVCLFILFPEFLCLAPSVTFS